MFESGKINLQMIRQFQPCFSSALTAFIEATVTDVAERANMTRPTPMTDTVDDYLRGLIDGLMNQAGWMASTSVTEWINHCRLDAFGAIIEQIPPDDTEKMEILGRVAASAPSAVGNLMELTAASA